MMMTSQHNLLPEDKNCNWEAIPTLFISPLISIYISKDTQPLVDKRKNSLALKLIKLTKHSVL